MARTERFGSATERARFERNKKKVLQTQEVCAICGRPVDKSLLYPHPLSPTVDHILPLAKGGTNELGNLQLAHWTCNRQKSDKLEMEMRIKEGSKKNRLLSNRMLPLSFDWENYSG